MACCRAAEPLGQGARAEQLAAALAAEASPALARLAQPLLAAFRVVRVRSYRDAMALAVVVALRLRPAQRAVQQSVDPGLQKACCRAVVLPGQAAACVRRVEALYLPVSP